MSDVELRIMEALNRWRGAPVMLLHPNEEHGREPQCTDDDGIGTRRYRRYDLAPATHVLIGMDVWRDLRSSRLCYPGELVVIDGALIVASPTLAIDSIIVTSTMSQRTCATL